MLPFCCLVFFVTTVTLSCNVHSSWFFCNVIILGYFVCNVYSGCFSLLIFQLLRLVVVTFGCFKISFSPSGLWGLERNNFLFMWLNLHCSWLSRGVLGSTM